MLYRLKYRDIWVAIRYAYRGAMYRDASMHRCIVTPLTLTYIALCMYTAYLTISIPYYLLAYFRPTWRSLRKSDDSKRLLLLIFFLHTTHKNVHFSFFFIAGIKCQWIILCYFDGISITQKLLKEIAEEISVPLVIVFNLSL